MKAEKITLELFELYGKILIELNTANIPVVFQKMHGDVPGFPGSSYPSMLDRSWCHYKQCSLSGNITVSMVVIETCQEFIDTFLNLLHEFGHFLAVKNNVTKWPNVKENYAANEKNALGLQIEFIKENASEELYDYILHCMRESTRLRNLYYDFTVFMEQKYNERVAEKARKSED